MPPFGSRKARTTEITEPELEPAPQPVELSAQERLGVLLDEQAGLQATIASHREERSRLLRESDSGVLGAVTALAAQTEQAALRLEQISLQLPDIQAAIERER